MVWIPCGSLIGLLDDNWVRQSAVVGAVHVTVMPASTPFPVHAPACFIHVQASARDPAAAAASACAPCLSGTSFTTCTETPEAACYPLDRVLIRPDYRPLAPRSMTSTTVRILMRVSGFSGTGLDFGNGGQIVTPRCSRSCAAGNALVEYRMTVRPSK